MADCASEHISPECGLEVQLCSGCLPAQSAKGFRTHSEIEPNVLSIRSGNAERFPPVTCTVCSPHWHRKSALEPSIGSPNALAPSIGSEHWIRALDRMHRSASVCTVCVSCSGTHRATVPIRNTRTRYIAGHPVVLTSQTLQQTEATHQLFSFFKTSTF